MSVTLYSPQDLALTVSPVLDPWHPNKLGHKVAADALLDYIVGTGQFTKWSSVQH
jgi:hypothetical protein